MSLSMSTTQQAGPSNQKNNQTFEFTKRKRFADLLITELAEAIILVLSADCKVLFCGTAVTELLGWRDEDLVDGDLLGLINDEDRTNFKNSFDGALRMREEVHCYIRMKCKSKFSTPVEYDHSPQEVLFEFKGRPHFVEGELDCKCVFAVAKPYPSRNTAMLNTFLELKMENERLQERLVDLRKRAPKSSVGLSALPSGYGSSSSMPGPSGHSFPSPITIPSQPYYPAGPSSATSYSHMRSPIDSNPFGGNANLSPYGGMFGSAPAAIDDDSLEDGGKKKKLKKSHLAEQYVCVTCGRTDSPEWRKGPQGPKTLCNACGLRWAKQQRKTDDSAGAGDSGNGESLKS